MERLPIFKGLAPLSVSAAQDLAVYMKIAGDTIGIISDKGHLITDQYIWPRICARDNFKVLKEAFEGNKVSWLKVSDDQIELDFSKIQYNVEWLSSIISAYGFGVKDSKDGLVLYTLAKANGEIWFIEEFWRLKGVSSKDVGARESRLVALSPNQFNPDTAKWGKLYFA